jgi:nitrate reductase beta subunit
MRWQVMRYLTTIYRNDRSMNCAGDNTKTGSWQEQRTIVPHPNNLRVSITAQQQNVAESAHEQAKNDAGVEYRELG